MQKIKPKIISKRNIHLGKVFDLVSATIAEGDREYIREIIEHRGSAVIIPLFEDGDIGFVRQYRHAAEKYLLELPAGSVEEGETPKDTAHREVEEEIGFRAKKLEKITEFYVSPGFLTEKMHVFLATGLVESKQNLDDDEILFVEKIPLGKALEMIENGEIEDAKTMIGLMLAAKRIGATY